MGAEVERLISTSSTIYMCLSCVLYVLEGSRFGISTLVEWAAEWLSTNSLDSKYFRRHCRSRTRSKPIGILLVAFEFLVNYRLPIVLNRETFFGGRLVCGVWRKGTQVVLILSPGKELRVGKPLVELSRSGVRSHPPLPHAVPVFNRFVSRK